VNTPPDITTLATELQQLAAATAHDTLPVLIGVLETAKAIAWARLAQPAEELRAAVPDVASMTASELAALYNVPRSFFYELARQGRVPCIRLGRYVRFNRADVERALISGRDSKMLTLEPTKKRRAVAPLDGPATAVLPARGGQR
jgi:excisionase family DNA binding protein